METPPKININIFVERKEVGTKVEEIQIANKHVLKG